jgi:hypothetical protein
VTSVFDFIFAFRFWSTTDRICSSSAPARSSAPRCLVSLSHILDFQQERALPGPVPRSDFSPRARTAPRSRFVSHLDSRVLLVFVPSLESGSGLNSILLVFSLVGFVSLARSARPSVSFLTFRAISFSHKELVSTSISAPLFMAVTDFRSPLSRPPCFLWDSVLP